MFIAAVMVALFYWIIINTPILGRLLYTVSNNGGIDDSSLARLIIQESVLKALSNNIVTLFLGTGFNELYVSTIFGIFTSPHNGFLNIAYKTGILYLLVLLLLYFYLCYKSRLGKSFVFYIFFMFILANLTADGLSYFTLTQFLFLYLGYNLKTARKT